MSRLTRLLNFVHSADSTLSAPRIRRQIHVAAAARIHVRISFFPSETAAFHCKNLSYPTASFCLNKPKVLSAMEPEGVDPPGAANSIRTDPPQFDASVDATKPDAEPSEIQVDTTQQNPTSSASGNVNGAAGVGPSNDDYSATGNSDGSGGYDRNDRNRVLPEELSRSVILLECESSAEGGSCDVYLVGTAHVSKESCREVQAVISFLKPQVVFLELCSNRVAILNPQKLEVPTMNEMINMWKKRRMNAFGILYSWFLAKVASKLEVLPGAEFRVAFEEAMNCGAKVMLGDRPVHITLRRTWGKMPLWHKAKFLYSMFFQALFLPSPDELNKLLKEMDDVDMLTLVIQEMSKAFPTLMETLLHERDMYMSSKLLQVAKEHSSVVAVVGKGHLAGIKKHWQQPVEMKDLMVIPGRTPVLSPIKILTSVGVAITGVAIIAGIYLAGKK
ncbi:hypothetical protein H6P81_007106 [Aristolochia fimbriata]|uniref:TraB family protein n=1 Tax=Aristolochia fimbriata TaxID=158543 RepID=A0AAV7F328_ARIFI|nr:hypothetical protein H6P81_007106 [Aristolochia fimbriata]